MQKNDSTTLSDLASGIRETLSLIHGVDAERIDVRVTCVPTDPERPEGEQRIRIAIDLDGKTPPPGWADAAQHVLDFAVGVTNAIMGAGAAVVTKRGSDE